jgi:hypothetical protein
MSTGSKKYKYSKFIIPGIPSHFNAAEGIPQECITLILVANTLTHLIKFNDSKIEVSNTRT